MKIGELIQLRKKIKAKKPDFIRQDAHKKKKLGKVWRRPKGIQSKMRLGKKGYRKSVEPGYGSPIAVKDLHKSGLQIAYISQIKDLETVDPKTQGIIAKSSLGQKKKVEILNKAKEKGIAVLNIIDISAYLKKIEDKIKAKKEVKEKVKKKKEERRKKLEKKTEKKEEKIEDKIATEEEKKEADKKEKDKILTKKDSNM